MPTLTELRKGIAKELGIKGRWKMKKQELEEAISRAQDDKKMIIPNKIKKPIPTPRYINPNNIDKPIPKRRKEESWFNWFAKNLRRVAEGLINYIPEGKVKDNAKKLLSLINKNEEAMSKFRKGRKRRRKNQK